MEHLLHAVGETAEKNLPAVLMPWIVVLLVLIFAGYKIATEGDPNSRGPLLAGVGVALIIWLALGSGVMKQARQLCNDARGTSVYYEQHCGTIEPAGTPFGGF